MRKKMTFLLGIAFALSVFLSISTGSSSFGLMDLFGGDYGARTVILSLRLPRVLGAILSGTALALSGMLLQTATGNDLASPNVIGVNSGAGVAVVLALAFFPALYQLLPLFAFLGALLSVFLVIGIKEGTRGEGRSGLVLAGVAVNALFNALILAVTTTHNEILSTYNAFQAGGFSGLYNTRLLAPGVVIALGTLLVVIQAGNLTKLSLGDEMAASLGVEVKKTRILALVTAALLASSAVVLCGLLGFVGLIVPHMTKAIYGEKIEGRILPAFFLASILLLLSDTLGRVVIAPSELPAGIFMAILGVPFFIWLLARRHHG